MTPEIQAAAKRYAMGDHPYWCDDGLGRLIFDSGLRDADLCTLADAYRALGERQPDEWAVTAGGVLWSGTEYLDLADAVRHAEICRSTHKDVKIVRVTTFLSPVDDDTTKGTP